MFEYLHRVILILTTLYFCCCFLTRAKHCGPSCDRSPSEGVCREVPAWSSKVTDNNRADKVRIEGGKGEREGGGYSDYEIEKEGKRQTGEKERGKMTDKRKKERKRQEYRDYEIEKEGKRQT